MTWTDTDVSHFCVDSRLSFFYARDLYYTGQYIGWRMPAEPWAAYQKNSRQNWAAASPIDNNVQLLKSQPSQVFRHMAILF